MFPPLLALSNQARKNVKLLALFDTGVQYSFNFFSFRYIYQYLFKDIYRNTVGTLACSLEILTLLFGENATQNYFRYRAAHESRTKFSLQ